jgi:hypothetical protein
MSPTETVPGGELMSTSTFEGIQCFNQKRNGLPLFVIAGGGAWSVQYAKALQWFIANQQVAVLVFYKSTYGMGDKNYLRYLQNTIRNMVEVEQWGAWCADESALSQEEMDRLPAILRPRAVFVVTPPDVHCTNALLWAPHADYVFIEKPLATSDQEVNKLRTRLGEHAAKVFGYDHYAARLLPLLKSESLASLQWGPSSSFLFEMFEAAPRGLVERGPSVNDIGMIFDMASHAVPLLKRISAGLNSVIEAPTTLCVSTLLNPVTQDRYISSETFAKLQFSFLAPSNLSPERIRAEVQIGKGIGAADSKLVRLCGASGTLTLDQLFMRAKYSDGRVSPIQERVIYTLVDDVLGGHPKDNVGVFPLEDGEEMMKVLSCWTSRLHEELKRNSLRTYYQGMIAKDICENQQHRNEWVLSFDKQGS